MMKGEAVVIFPESYHQDKHHLGDFSLGYLRMAFETAEQYHFEQEISILPMAITIPAISEPAMKSNYQ